MAGTNRRPDPGVEPRIRGLGRLKSQPYRPQRTGARRTRASPSHSWPATVAAGDVRREVGEGTRPLPASSRVAASIPAPSARLESDPISSYFLNATLSERKDGEREDCILIANFSWAPRLPTDGESGWQAAQITVGDARWGNPRRPRGMPGCWIEE